MCNRIGWSIVLPLLAASLAATPATEPSQPGDLWSNSALSKEQRERAEARLGRAKGRLGTATENYDALLNEAEQMRDWLRKKTNRVDVSPQALAQAATKLEAFRDELLLDAAGARARRGALANAIAEKSSHAEAETVKDPVVSALAVVVKEHEDNVKRLEAQFKAATVSAADVSSARAALATAQANLAEKRREAAMAAGGDQLNLLTRELTQLSIASAERDARLKFITSELQDLREVTPALEKLEVLDRRVRRAQRVVDDAQAEADSAERALDNYR
jgi:myosin heavy subunit